MTLPSRSSIAILQCGAIILTFLPSSPSSQNFIALRPASVRWTGANQGCSLLLSGIFLIRIVQLLLPWCLGLSWMLVALFLFGSRVGFACFPRPATVFWRSFCSAWGPNGALWRWKSCVLSWWLDVFCVPTPLALSFPALLATGLIRRGCCLAFMGQGRFSMVLGLGVDHSPLFLLFWWGFLSVCFSLACWAGLGSGSLGLDLGSFIFGLAQVVGFLSFVAQMCPVYFLAIFLGVPLSMNESFTNHSKK